MRHGPIAGDAFGQMLLECLVHDEPVTEVVERDDGRVDIGDARRYFAPASDWSPSERAILQGASGRVIDIGAGAGRHSLELQRSGHSVVALDLSPGAVQTMHSRGVEETFEGTLFQFARTQDAAFDTALLLGNNLGLLGGPAQAIRWLAALDRLLAAGGRVLGSGSDPYATTDTDHLRYHARNRLRGRMGGQNRIRSRFRTLASPWFDYLFASLDELTALLVDSTWHIAEVIDAAPGYWVELRRR
ncbi:MAG: class I SAM-dependent methyltransferase [Dehalococcoidia bacterium]